MKTICQIGMERSGNHAVMRWFITRYNHRIVLQRIQPRFSLCKVATACHGNHVMSKEQRAPDLLFENYLNGNVREPDRAYDLRYILLRDPYNWLASLVRFYKFHWQTHNYRFFVQQWLSHAESICHGAKWINYNHWCTEDGKQFYQDMLEMPDFINGSHPTNIGRESSFGGNRDYGKRYLHVLENEDDAIVYKYILGLYPEVHALASSMFGIEQPKELEGTYIPMNTVIKAFDNRKHRKELC